MLASTIFGTLIIVSVTNGLRVCNDCVTTIQCPQAWNLLTIRSNDNRSDRQIIINKIRNATCSIEKEIKICCSDFMDIQLHGIENAEHEIENHRNIKLLPNECGKIPSSRLLGGLRSQYDFSWLVLIASRDSRCIKFACEGTLISSKYVLTTAHCIKNKHIFGVRVVDYNDKMKMDCFVLRDSRKCKPIYQDIGLSRAIMHEAYRQRPVPVNDIGLLRLTSPVDFSLNTVGPVCLPVFRSHLDTNLYDDRATVAGWSMKGNEITTDTLYTKTIPIHNHETCRLYLDRYKNYNLTSHMEQKLCAGELGSDMCIEGEGVPLMLLGEFNTTYKFIQYGIKSHGPTICGTYNVPEFYIDVRKFMKWILDSIEP